MLLALKDILQIEELDSLFQKFYEITQIGVGIADENGNMVVAKGWQDICTKFHRIHPVTKQKCVESDNFIKKNLDAKKPVSYKCKNGMWDFAQPIMVDGFHVATIYFGQFFYENEKPDEDFFVNQARLYNFNEADYLNALKTIPIYSKEKVNHIVEFYSELAQNIANKGYLKLSLLRENYRIEKAFNQLQDLYLELELSNKTIIEKNQEIETQNEELQTSDEELRNFNNLIQNLNHKLVLNEKRYKNLVENCSELISELDEDGVFIFANKNHETILGYTPDELIGTKAIDIIHPDDIANSLNKYKEIIQRHSSSIDYWRFRCKNGLYKSMECRGNVFINDAGKKNTIVISQDVSNKLEQQLKLTDSEAELSAIYENSPVLMLLLNSNKKIHKVNNFAIQGTGKTIDNLLGFNCGDAFNCIHHIDSPDGCGYGPSCSNCKLRNIILDTLKTGNNYNNTEVTIASNFLNKDINPTYLVSSTGLTIKGERYALLSLIDITARKSVEKELQSKTHELEATNEEIAAANEELQASSEALKSANEELTKSNKELVNAYERIMLNDIRLSRAEKIANFGNWELDLNTRVITASEGTCILYGFSENVLKFEQIKNIPLPEYRKVLDNALKDLIYLGKPYDVEFKIKRESDGKILDIHSIAIYDNIRQKVFGILHDITARKHAEQSEMQVNERLKSTIKILQYQEADIQKYLDFALGEAIRLTSSKIGYIYFYDEAKQEFVLNSWSKDVLEECSVMNPQTRYALEKTGIWGEVVRQRKSILLNDFKAHNPLKKGTPQGHVQLNNFLSVPVISENKIVAVVGVANKSSNYNEFDELQLSLLMENVWRVTEQKKSVIALKESENKFRDLVETTNEIIWETNLDGVFTYVSPQIRNLLGYKPEEWVGKSPFDFMPADKVHEAKIKSDKIVKAAQAFNNWINYYQHKNGQIIILSTSGVPIFDEKEKLILYRGIHLDITEQKILQIEFEKSARTYKNVIQSIPIGMFIYQYKAPDKLFLIEGNNSAEKLTGLVVNDWIGKEFNEIWPNAKKQGITDSYLRVAKTGIGIDLEDTYYADERVSGAFRIYAFQFDIDKIAIAFLNVTEIKKVEVDLQKAKEKAEDNESKLKMAQEIAKLGSWELDVKTGIFTFNDNFYKVFHTNAEQIGGYQMTIENYAKQFVHPDDAFMVAEETKLAIESNNQNYSKSVRHRIKFYDGGYGYVNVKIFIVKDGFGKTIKTYGVNQDITEQKIAEDALIESQKQLQIKDFAIQSSISAIGLADLEGGLIYANKAFLRMWGYKTLDEILGRHISEFALSKELVFELMEALKINQAYAGEGVSVHTNGSKFNFHFTANLVCNEQGIPICLMASFMDITKEKKNQEDLIKLNNEYVSLNEEYKTQNEDLHISLKKIEQSEMEYSKLFDSMFSAFATHEIICNENGKPIDYKFLKVNKKFETLTGLKAENIIGKTVLEVMPNTESYWIDAYGKVALTGESLHIENYSQVIDKYFEVNAYCPQHGYFAVQFLDISERRNHEVEKEATIKLFSLLNTTNNLHELMKTIIVFLKEWTKCEAIGIRLKENEDFPYYEYSGFSKEFVSMENSLCTKDLNGQLLRDEIGNPVLECMCGNILCGRFDPSKSFFTEFGSFYSNNTTALLATTTDANRQARTRNRCNGEGYESVALIPLKSGDTTFGLLQLNDFRIGKLAKEKITIVERLASNIAKALSEKMAQKALEESEKALKISQNYYNALINANPDLMFIITNDYYFVDCRAPREKLFASPEEFLGKELSESLPIELANLTKENIDKLIATNEEQIYYYQMPLYNTMRYYESRLVKIDDSKNLALIRDITEQRMAELSLKASEEQFRGVWENSNDGMRLITESGIIIEANQAFCNLFQHQKEEIIGKSFVISYHESERDEFMKSYLNKVKNHKISDLTDGEFLIWTGEKKWLQVSHTPIYLENSEVVTLSVFRDITLQKQNEILKHDVIVAENTAKIKQEFLANMSHEIRTPLSGIIGMVEFLAKTRLNNEQSEYVKTIRDASESLIFIINDILDLSKIEAGKVIVHSSIFKLEDLKLKVNGIFGSLKKQKPITLNFNVDSKLPSTIKSDESKIFQITNNFVSNAIKFTNQGEITVSFSLLQEQENLLKIKISVQDTGMGISKENAAKLFNKFSQIDSSATRQHIGTGLGLAICKELTTMLGGEIGVESELDKGSTFWFTFKAEKIISEVSETAKKSPPIPEKISAHILLVDDIIVNRTVFNLQLKSMGCTVEMATNGVEALELFEPNKYDIILMDIQMPIMDGIQATIELKKKYKNVPPIIGLSANALEGDAEKYIALGMNDYLSKPVTIIQLYEKIKKWIDKQ